MNNKNIQNNEDLENAMRNLQIKQQKIETLNNSKKMLELQTSELEKIIIRQERGENELFDCELLELELKKYKNRFFY